MIDSEAGKKSIQRLPFEQENVWGNCRKMQKEKLYDRFELPSSGMTDFNQNRMS